jgi:hypothetical protein
MRRAISATIDSWLIGPVAKNFLLFHRKSGAAKGKLRCEEDGLSIPRLPLYNAGLSALQRSVRVKEQ